LSLWHYFKATYINGVIFNYRSRIQELSLKFALSTKTLYKYISILKKNGLVYDFNNNLNLVSIRHIKKLHSEKKKSKIHLNCLSDKLWTVACKLQSKLIENHLKSIAFSEALRRYGNRNLNNKDRSASDFLPSFSIRNAAKLLKMNERTIIKVFITLESLDIIKIIESKFIKISYDQLPVDILTDFPGYRFYSNQGTFLRHGNMIELKEYPLKLPKINYKLYAKYCKSV
jgi:hypothetical protein